LYKTTGNATDEYNKQWRRSYGGSGVFLVPSLSGSEGLQMCTEPPHFAYTVKKFSTCSS